MVPMVQRQPPAVAAPDFRSDRRPATTTPGPLTAVRTATVTQRKTNGPAEGALVAPLQRGQSSSRSKWMSWVKDHVYPFSPVRVIPSWAMTRGAVVVFQDWAESTQRSPPVTLTGGAGTR